ncbi:MAG: tetratricopeptide repeat protein [Anaerolineaceae bacterium]
MIKAAGNVDTASKMVWVNGLIQHGLPDLAHELASRWIDIEDIPGSDQPASVQKACDRAALLLAAGNAKTAVETLSAEMETLQALQAKVAGQLAHAAYQDSDLLTAVQAAEQAVELINPADRPSITPFYARLLAETGHIDDARQHISPDAETTDNLFSAAIVYSSSGDDEQARTAARKAWQVFQTAPSIHNPKEYFSLIDHLTTFGLTDEARAASQMGCKAFPTCHDLLTRQVELGNQSGKASDALPAAELAAALKPEDFDFRRRLAGLYAQSGAWEQELEERQTILAQTKSPTTADTLAVAASALHANQPDLTKTLCQKVIQSDPENGLAHAYLGRVYQRHGDTVEALQHLTQATLLIPDQPLSWLSLAELQQSTGDHIKALETLRAAALAAPESPEIQLSLGKLYLSREAPSQAITYLRQAAALRPADQETALFLGKTLQALGRPVEACAILAKARQTEPLNPDLAYQHALALIATNEKSSALPVLSIALNARPTDVQPYILYASTVLEILGNHEPSRSNEDRPNSLDKEITNEALTYLQQALSISPEDMDARLLLADTLAASGDAEKALTEYAKLADKCQKDPNQSWRIQFGMGRAALTAGKMETALASLHEAAQNHPDNLFAQQMLVKAYEAAHLPDEAMQVARKAVQLAPHDIDNLLWFANTAERLNKSTEAVDTLHRAEQLAPDHPELLLSISRHQAEIGDLEAAAKTLSRLLAVETASPQDLHRAAKSFMSIGQFAGAAAALNQAIQISSSPSAEFYNDLATVQEQAENYQVALEAVQTAAEIAPQEVQLYLHQSDILTRMGRHQAAIACLQHALQLDHASRDEGTKTISHSHKILSQMSTLDLLVGDYTHALQHALDAHHSESNDLATRCAAANLAMDLLETDLAAELVSTFDLAAPEATTPEAVDLLALKIEVALDRHEISKAEIILHSLPEDFQPTLRFSLDQARLLILQGEIASAEEVFRNISTQLPTLATSRAEDLNVTRILTSAATLLAGLYRWNEAFALLQQLTTMPNPNPRALMALCKTMLHALLALPICQSLDVKTHAPDPAIRDTSHHQLFQQTILKLQSVSASPEIQRCQMMGELMYGASPSQAEQVIGKPQNDAERSAFILSYAEDNNLIVAKQFADAASDEAQSWLTWGLVQMQTDPISAARAVQNAVEMMPSHPLVLAASAKIPTDDDALFSQITAWENALSIWQNEPEWHIHTARLYQQNEADVDAIRHYQIASDLAPQNFEITLALGNLYLNQGDAGKAVQMLEPLSRSADSDVNVWNSLARGYMQMEKTSEAARCIDEALALKPDDTASLLLSGTIALAMGNSTMAQERAAAVLAADPQNADAVLLATGIEVTTGNYAKALNMLEAALPVVRDSHPILTEKIRIVQRSQGAQAAATLLEDAIRKYPDDPKLLSMLAEAYTQLGQRELATRMAQAALSLTPDDPDIHLLLGRLQRKTGQLDQAIFHLSEAIREIPESVEPYLELGRTYQERREYLQAIQVYKQAIQIAPKDSRSYYQAGLLLRENKDYQGAENMLRKASELAPEDLNIRRQLGAIIALNLVYHPQETGHTA